MAARSRFLPADLQAWRTRRGLTVREMAWVLGIPLGTLKDKLSGRHPQRLRLDTDRAIDCVDMLLALGVPPPGWPMRLNGRVHVNRLETPLLAIVPLKPPTDQKRAAPPHFLRPI